MLHYCRYAQSIATYYNVLSLKILQLNKIKLHPFVLAIATCFVEQWTANNDILVNHFGPSL